MPASSHAQTRCSIPTLRDAFAAVPGLQGRTVSVRATLAIDTCAAIRIRPGPGERSIGDLPRRAHEAYCAWNDALRNIGIMTIGIETTIDVVAAAPSQRPALMADHIDRLSDELRNAIAGTYAGPHDLLIHARQAEASWCLYGLADLPEHRRERVSNILDDHVGRIRDWLERSAGCALLIPDLTERSKRHRPTVQGGVPKEPEPRTA
jgi:hypothetical protein